MRSIRNLERVLMNIVIKKDFKSNWMSLIFHTNEK